MIERLRVVLLTCLLVVLVVFGVLTLKQLTALRVAVEDVADKVNDLGYEVDGVASEVDGVESAIYEIR